MVVEYIKKSWNTYFRNFKSIITSLFVVYVIIFASIFLSLIPMFGASSSALAITGLTYNVPVGVTNTALLISLVFLAVSLVLSVALTGGLVRFYSDCLRRKGRLSTIFSVAKEKFLSLIAANAIVVAIIFVIFLVATSAVFIASPALSSISIFVGAGLVFFLSPLFLYVNQAVVLSNMGAVDAVKRSYNFGKKRYLETLGLLIIYIIIGVVFSIIPVVGFLLNLFIMAPLSTTSYIILYGKGRK